jgi:NhaP-type Na+/H+ or K+/H+ antiporter
VKRILHEFHLITIETAFVVRTFFFVVFGATIALASLFNIRVFLESFAILVTIFALRWILLIILWKRPIKTELGIAPRGLITILLFFAIPQEFQIPEFDSGTLLYVILVTSILMTWSLIANKKTDLYDNLIDEDITTETTTVSDLSAPTESNSENQEPEEPKQLD